MSEVTDWNAVADVLDRAADALWIYGRARGVGQSDDGSMCVRGAILHAEGRDPSMVMGIVSEANSALERYIHLHRDEIADDWTGLPNVRPDRYPSFIWNDRHWREQDDEMIRDSLRRCAKELREQAGESCNG